MTETDKKAVRRWNKSEISYINYTKYISTKIDKFKLTLIDLLYVSNFKGGYATINEPEEIIEEKLVAYEQLFKEINTHFSSKVLKNLNDIKVKELIAYSEKLIIVSR